MSATAVVTGLGVAAPNGLGAADFWAATLSGTNGIAPIQRFDPAQYPSRLAGEVPGFVPQDHLPARLMPQTDPMTRLALAASGWALDDAGLDTSTMDEYDMGVVTASSSGGFEFGQRELEALWSKGGQYVSAYQSFAWFYAVNTGQISIRHGMRGPSGVVVSDQAGGLDAVAQARRNIRRGTPVVVSGAVDSSLCPWSWVAHLAGGGLSARNEPDRAFVPFDAQACGYVPGEGGAILVVEDLDSARQRGAAQCYGAVAGYGASFDPHPDTGRPPNLEYTILTALADADLSPTDIDVVFADGYGLPDLDAQEAAAIRSVFGPGGVPVTVPKTMTGRLYAGGGALDLAAALLSIRDGVIPPTTNVERLAAGCADLDLVRDTTRSVPVRVALVLARGRGGFNAAMVVTAID